MKVNSLTHMVVVVDENSGEGATAALEEQLQVRLPGYRYFRCENDSDSRFQWNCFRCCF